MLSQISSTLMRPSTHLAARSAVLPLARKFSQPASSPSSLVEPPSGTDPHEFTVTYNNGFLPLHEPLTHLPAPFEPLHNILERMPVELEDGSKGLLHDGKLADVVHRELPMFDMEAIERANKQVLAALYRDLTYLTSAYLLEPCDINYRKTGSYGLGRDRLPAQIAVPLVRVAEKLNAKPFMEYALSYALYNWRRIDRSKGMEYENLKLIRRFHGGAAESGFILVHVAMVAHTGTQVRNTDRVIKAAEAQNRDELNEALTDYHTNLVTINRVMDTMWTRSEPRDYLKLRTFIMGTKDQPMFPKGVVYEGVDTEPRYYRGESGANDSIIPTCDNLFDLHFPSNPMTGILLEFRSYRPSTHESYLQDVKERSKAAKVREFALADPNTAVRYLANIDMVREFRMRHWNFTKEYIIRHSSHPVATGGSPITTWLPNQLSGVLTFMEEVVGSVQRQVDSGKALSTDNQALFESIKTRSNAQLRILQREVADLRKRFNQ